jgi:hypothetical protein
MAVFGSIQRKTSAGCLAGIGELLHHRICAEFPYMPNTAAKAGIENIPEISSDGAARDCLPWRAGASRQQNAKDTLPAGIPQELLLYSEPRVPLRVAVLFFRPDCF